MIMELSHDELDQALSQDAKDLLNMILDRGQRVGAPSSMQVAAWMDETGWRPERVVLAMGLLEATGMVKVQDS